MDRLGRSWAVTENVSMNITADYVIVGSGSAGAVLAARLSENPAVTVVLLEAGKDRTKELFVRMPAGSFAMMQRERYDWSYQTEPDPTIGNRTLNWSGGKMLGGSSSINGMVYVRGNRQDYDRWEADGAIGWGWNAMLPYFLRSEQFTGPNSQWHGSHGPMKVGPANARHPICDAVIGAFEACGVPRLSEYCAGEQFGVYDIYTTAPGGTRRSTAEAFLSEARHRQNLTIVTDAMADKVIIKDGCAVGVRALVGGEARDFMAGEVIVSAGTLQSPGVLMRSGIGPSAHLQELGIPVVADLPVGRNLHDHNGVSTSRFIDMPTYNSPFGPWTIAKNLARWMIKKDGPMASAAVHVMAGVKSHLASDEADVSISMLALAIDISSGAPRMSNRPGITIGGSNMRPRSRGELRLRSTDPRDKPVIDHRLLSDESDLERLVFFLKFVDQVWSSQPLSNHVTGMNSPERPLVTDDERRDWIRSMVGIGYHPVGTCRMGGVGSVCDPELRVRGVSGLRVCDASVMPQVVSGNTNAATIALAERAADLIRG
ncbi:GMC family oxidoreductase [Novosphingobium taihuense]|nr:GMC family oxidoreductase N-terminal domain-containing protein [Novosphingobium taihuense]